MNARFVSRSLVGAALLAGAASIAPALAEGAFDRPAGAHFNPQKLERIGEFFRNEIANGKIPGAIVLIQQHGKPVYFEKFGLRDVTTKLPMTDDTIFTVYSMSKPVTSVAAMMLIDQGKLKLTDPVANYIPSFATAKVGVEMKAENGENRLELAPLNRPITILDLMRHTSGITYGFYGDSLVRKLYANALLYGGDFDNAEFAERIARLPLAEQPGTLWDYGHSTDVLGRVIEVISGKSLLQFEKEKLLDPLGMPDTSFYVTDPARLPLLAEPLPNDNNFRAGSIRNARRMMKWESGGGGMISTIADFAKFSQMLLNGGSLAGKQYLSPQAFNEMAADHVGPNSGIGRDYFYFPGDGFGFGLGFAVRTDPGNAKPPPPGSLGELKWDGASGCYFIIDRKQDMFFILMQQTPSQRQRIQPALKKLIYEAMEN
ncbi:MAG TPA: serine hydrolase domain-containing protein [Bradyrhizobium sp.]|jgi:CubicO group peptidase (beta-lactamase class C family)|nr:serine hydrolase domain-containing protein [Bradyrhizobium sp.]